MITKHKYGDATWIDLESPSKEEIIDIIKEWNIDLSVANELSNPSFRAKIDSFENYAYLVLHFPASMTKRSKNKRGGQEIDFIIGREFLITAHYNTIYALHEFEKKFNEPSENAGRIFYSILRELYAALVYQLDLISERLHKAEYRIFQGEEKDMVEALSQINRELIDFHRDVYPHKDIFAAFENQAKILFNEKYRNFSHSLNSDIDKAQNTLKNNEEVLKELRETNDSLLTTKNNETMKHLTMMAFVTFPLSLIVAILDIDTRTKFIVGQENDLWIIITIIIISLFGMFAFFKHKKWL